MSQSNELKQLLNRTGFSLEEIADKSVIKLSTLKRVLYGTYTMSEALMRSVRAVDQFPVFDVGQDGSKIASVMHLVPVVSWARAGTLTTYLDLPSDWMKRIGTDANDKDAFGVEIKGDSMEPKYWEGETAILLPSHEARNGDLVVARTMEQDVLFKILHVRGKKYEFSSYNPAYRPLEFSDKQLHWIYPVHSVVRHVRRT